MDEPENLRRRGKVNQEQPRKRKGSRGQDARLRSKSGFEGPTIKASPKKPGRMKQTAPNRAVKAKAKKSPAQGKSKPAAKQLSKPKAAKRKTAKSK